MLKKLFPYVKGYGWYALAASATVMVEVLLEVYIPFLMADIIDVGIATGDVDFIIKRGLLMVGMALLSLVAGAVCARFAVVASTGFACNLRTGLFKRVQSFSFSNVDKFQTSSLITRLTTDVTNTQQSFMMIIRMLIRSPFMMVAASIMALRINSELGVVLFVAIPALGIGMGTIMALTFPRFREMLKRYDALNGEVQENLIAVRVVKAFVRGAHEVKNFTEANEGVRSAQVRAEKNIAIGMPMAQFILYGCMIAVCWLGGKDVVSGAMETGDLMSFISYLSQILMSVIMMMMILLNLVLTRASISRIAEVLDEKSDIEDIANREELPVESGSVEFDDVCFSYSKNPDKMNLEHVSFSIASGETVGIIGGTGSAKTTLVQLIPRLYDVLSGSVKVGGHDVREYKIETLRNAVSMVLQKNVLFSGTIRENLRWGDPDATDEQIVSACKTACAHDFIMSFPQGYDTVLGQGGVNVSGGQKQRLTIARALLKKPKVIILDDSTSAVDTATDASIRKGLKTELCETTTIIIAQRIASVMDADRIMVLNEGKLADFGTHDELMERNDIYREVYQSQRKGDE